MAKASSGADVGERAERPVNVELVGLPVCGGSRVGPALIYDESLGSEGSGAALVAGLSRSEPPTDLPAEVERLSRAAREAQAELERLLGSLGGEGGVGGIFRAQGLMIEGLLPQLVERVRAGTSAERAVTGVLRAAAARLAGSSNRLMAQRSQDVVDVERRLLRALLGLAPDVRTGPAGGNDPVVVVAHDLSPSETAALEGRAVAALALEEGGVTSHSALIAKSLGIPCVVGVRGLLSRVQHGDRLWVDGTAGRVVLHPDAAAVGRARELGERYDRLERTLVSESRLPAETLDGHKVVLLANIEFPLDVEAGLDRGAEGVGLFRTEYLWRPGQGLPDEEEHVRAYRSTLERMGGGCLTVRTFDFGSDKEAPEAGPPEPNPALGVRSLRWCFEHPQAFHVQLRALLRVAAEGDLRIMLPMVGSLEELRRARVLLAAAARELAAQGLAHRADVPVGVMIELPAAAVTADLLIEEADFFSIGTNDLIQYDLAVDRLNPRLAPLFRPSHPSILRLLRDTIAAATRCGKPVTLCGEMGGHSIYTVLLLGLGLREFSLTPGYIPRVRRLLRGLTLVHARSLAEACLRLNTAEAVEAHLRAHVTPVGAG